MKKWLRVFQNLKLKRKLMTIYICIGTIPIFLLGVFAYLQEHSMLVEREQRTIQDSLNQGVDQLNSRILVYNNLSDYIAFNQPVSEVLGGDCDTIYEMYDQYTDTVDPVLSSLRYFNPAIHQITIYLDKKIVKHDTTVAPLSVLENETWYQERRESLTQEAQWIVDRENQKAFSVCKMPLLERTDVFGVLYLDVDYQDLFDGFSEITREEYGLYVLDEKQNIIYQSGELNRKKSDRLSVSKLLQEQKKISQGKHSKYMIVSSKTMIDGWQVIVYRSDYMIAEEMRVLLLLVGGIIAICLFTSFVASQAFSRLVVKDIERLQDNMQAVENGNMELVVTSEAKDEIGGLIRGFGSMLSEINRLIHEVYESKLTLRKSEMTALQAQINPHFLYNSLSLINWKALEAGKEDISRITLALSSFYRTSLNRGKNVLTIEKELENMQSYLEIQSCMHDGEFDVLMDIDDSILPYQTLNLLLQPLVENAIEHGIDLKEDGRGYIKIIGRKDEKTIYLIVEDNGVGIEPDVLKSILEFKTKGYGVRNVNERIQLYYGEEYALQVESEVGKGTRCTITLPIREMDV